jgi:GAF domain-containing protein
MAPFRSALDTLTELLVEEEPLATVLQRIVTLARAGIGGCDLASITLMHEGAPETIVFTDPAADTIDQAQYADAEGPCLEAFRTASVVSVPFMVNDTRWPTFADAAIANGVGSSFSLPLAVGNARVGALNLYGREGGAFDSVPSDLAAFFAKQAAAALWNVRTRSTTREVIANLEIALAHRDTIGMAKGIIMAKEKVTPDEAFKILTTTSQRRNVKLRDIAAEIVAAGATPT